jgi:hypothetical protein
MALELFAALIAAAASAGMVHLLRRLSGWRLPPWTVPVAAGLGMIGFTIWNEYDWYGRVTDRLPAGVAVVWTNTGANPLRPWTYLAPVTTRFIAMDGREVSVHPADPGLRIVRLYNFARWEPAQDRMMVFDCGASRQVTLTEGIKIDADGTLTGAEWVSVSSEDGFQKAACQEA